MKDSCLNVFPSSISCFSICKSTNISGTQFINKFMLFNASFKECHHCFREYSFEKKSLIPHYHTEQIYNSIQNINGHIYLHKDTGANRINNILIEI